MKKLLWVHRDAFDVILDSPTWFGMTWELKQLGVDTTIIGGFKNRPIAIDSSVNMKWVGPMSGGWTNVLITLKIWLQVLREYIKNGTDFIILDIPTFWCAFPIDILAKIGLCHSKVILDLRTFDFGVNSNQPTIKDRCWYIYTRFALLYNRLFHFGITTITKALAEKVLEYYSSRNITIWGSGYTLPKEIDDSKIVLEYMPDELLRDHFLIIYHGSIHSNRGLAQAIKGVEIAYRRGANVFFMIIGDGPGKQEFINLVLQIDGSKFCKIIPPVEHEKIYCFISKAKLGIMTYPDLEYWTYNHPIKLAEYLSLGKPVICTDIPMFRNAIQDAGCLYFVEKDCPELIADQLIRIINDPVDLEKRSRIAKEEAKRLTWANQACILFSFLNQP
jgi:glycosyltransferase involved in cell wall biosynthesis